MIALMIASHFLSVNVLAIEPPPRPPVICKHMVCWYDRAAT